MYNFISTFDELNKLYEEVETKKVEEACTEELTEAADDEEIEIVDDETSAEEVPTEEIPAEESVVEEEPRRVICECDKCGALVIKDEADIVADEESDLVNVEDECQFCEEAKGFKVIGVVVPYEAVAEELPEEETADEEPVVEEPTEEETVEESAELDEGIDHWYHKKFDKPYSVSAQQDLEAEYNGECGEISDARRREIEDIFNWQRDWEKRHADEELEELFDIKPSISLGLHGGSGNDVSVLGH